MSHVVTIKTKVRDTAAVNAACGRLKLPPAVQGSFRLFSGNFAGLGVRLREWRYPLVCQTDSGDLKYDNYGGRWGNPQRLDEFLQAYGVEKARIEAHKQGHAVAEQRLSDGSIKLTIQMGVGHENH